MDKLDELCEQLLVTKAQLAVINSKKNEIESQIADLIEHNTEGSKIEKTDSFKITKKVNFGRSFSATAFQKWLDAGGAIDEKYHDLVKHKLVLNESICKKIEKEDEETNKEIAKFITLKQNKTGITVERIEDKD